MGIQIKQIETKKSFFVLTECGYIEDADYIQASFNLLDRGLKQLGIDPNHLRAIRPKVTAVYQHLK